MRIQSMALRRRGAPTNYFLVAAPDRVRVNCDLEHVTVVLCCDPKIFLHTNPLHGMQDGGAFVWESDETAAEKAWERIPRRFRQFIIDKKIRLFTLHGFDIAKRATHREDLQTRMQGNAFLGAFFGVSPFLKDYRIPDEEFLATVREQYVKKFGRLGDAVVKSNMTVMRAGLIQDQSNCSVIPERLADALLDACVDGFTEDDWFRYTHFTDAAMTDQEILELPKVWVIGGDGAMGDIGYQNVSKVILQNRPNVKMLMLNTQVYSNTGGQNADSSPMTGGFDMNQAGAATEGKRHEIKCVAESFVSGHGSPYVAQVSMANTGALYKAMIDGLYYRGTAFYHIYTTCQPEHGVPDWASSQQALLVRDSRGMPEFVFNPTLGETYAENFSIKGDPQPSKDWYLRTAPVTRIKYQYTPAHWAFTEARFRLHHKIVKEDQIKDKILLEDLLQLVTQNDVVHVRHLDPTHRAYIPTFGVYTLDHKADGKSQYHLLSRQMVLFCVERGKAWRILQSRAGVENKDYQAQKELIAQIESGDLTREAFLNRSKVEALNKPLECRLILLGALRTCM